MHKRVLGLIGLLMVAMWAMPATAQATVRIVVNRDNVNVRIIPAIGGELVATVNAGTTFVANGRSPDSQWLQIDFNGGEAWVGFPVITVVEGDVNALPIRDPRSIPYGGAEAPRAGFTSQTSEIRARLPLNGVRIRSGPSTAYPILANALRFEEFFLLGRTANNQWVQVNFEGTLGWVSIQYIEILNNRNILELPIDGVVASDPPTTFESFDSPLFGVLRLMRDRIDLAQYSLDEMRRVWTDASQGIAPFCGGYPARPTDFNLQQDVYARYYATLDPLIQDFNLAMADLRNSIDLWIEACNRPGSQAALTSIPVTSGGLQLLNNVDSKFASLRRRIDELLPELGPDSCVFEFFGRVDILDTLPVDVTKARIIKRGFSPRQLVWGFCIDVTVNTQGLLDLVQENQSQEPAYNIVVAFAPIDDPTNFVYTQISSSGQAGSSEKTIAADLRAFPITFPTTGRYLLLVIADIDEGTIPNPEDEFALIFVDFPYGTPSNPFFDFDENGNVILRSIEVTFPSGGKGIVSLGSALQTEQTATATATPTSGSSGTGVDTVSGGSTTTPGVQNGSINVYSAADANSSVVGTVTLSTVNSLVATGTTVTGTWLPVTLPNGTTGFVLVADYNALFAQLTTALVNGTIKLRNDTGANVVLYSTAATTTPTGGVIPTGETVTVIAYSTVSGVTWTQIRKADNTSGWTNSTLTTVSIASLGGGTTVTGNNANSSTNLSTGGTSFCPGVTLSCDDLFTCQEVQACITLGSTVLDPNGNGVACDATEGVNPLGCTVSTTP